MTRIAILTGWVIALWPCLGHADTITPAQQLEIAARASQLLRENQGHQVLPLLEQYGIALEDLQGLLTTLYLTSAARHLSETASPAIRQPEGAANERALTTDVPARARDEILQLKDQVQDMLEQGDDAARLAGMRSLLESNQETADQLFDFVQRQERLP